MINKTRDGNTWTGAAPYALTAGQGALVGSLFGVAVNAAANGATVVLHRKGVFTLEKTTSQAWTAGLLLYWDNTTRKVTSTASTNKAIGVADVAAGSADTTGSVLLTGQVS